MPTHKNPDCDNVRCALPTGEVRKLPAGAGSNMILCRACYDYEIAYRKLHNRTYWGATAPMQLPAWKDLEVYIAC